MSKLYIEDENMLYDINTHRYYITPKYFLNTYGEDLNNWEAMRRDKNPKSAAERFLKRCSLVLYNFIYSYTRGNHSYEEYLIAGGDPSMRGPLMEALGEFAYQMFLSGNDLSVMTGLTLEGKVLNKRDIKNQKVSEGVEIILKNAGIIFAGKHRIEDVDYLDRKTAGDY